MTTNLLRRIYCFGSVNKKFLLPSLSIMPSIKELSTEKQINQRVNGLPKLPVPPLMQTMERLKMAVKPFTTTSDDLENLYKIIDEFSKSNGIGSKLHSLLELKSSQTTNWLSHDWWINKAYLEGRDPVMIWSNPGLVFPDLQTPKQNDREFVVQFISRLILSAIDFRDSLRKGINPELSEKDGQKVIPPLCMDQYNKIYGTCRIPGNPIDSIRFGTLEANEVTVIISRFNKFYKLSLSQTDKHSIYKTINSAIAEIMSKTPSETIPFGSFSSLPRNDFATVFRLLNQKHLNDIIESDFVVNIDHIQNESFESNESYYKLMGKQSLHSDIDNIGNRWFDKTIQLIVVTNKSGDRVIGSAFCYEHTPAEGGAIVKLMEHTIKHTLSYRTQSTTQLPKPVLQELCLVSDENREKIKFSAEFSKQKYLNFINSIDLEILEFKDYGKEFIKSVRCSPDSWIQLAIAFAYYRLHGSIGATYESGGTRKFAFGRTDTIRSVTNDFKQFFKSPNFQTLINGIESHKNLAKDVVNGNGIDRLLLGYNCVAQELKSGKWMWGLTQEVLDNPLTPYDYEILEKLYSNELYLRSKHFHMSTSQVASISPQAFMCYGPLVYDGYGCCYNPSKNQIVFAISAFNQNNSNTSALNYKTELSKTLDFMKQLVLKQSKL